MKNKPVIMFTVDVEALPLRDTENHVEHLIYNRFDGKEYGINYFMDIADKYGFKMTFFLDLAEYELYGDDLIRVGKLIVKRGHDLQVHLHHTLLNKKLGKYPQNELQTALENPAIVKEYINYIESVWLKITDKKPVAFRGGGYHFGAELLRQLKQAGYKADCSYNCYRPFRLPNIGAFRWENGLIEFPISIVNGKQDINFNFNHYCPKNADEFSDCIEYWLHTINDFAAAKSNTPTTIMMHSWSMLSLGVMHPVWEHCEIYMPDWTEFLFKALSENFTIQTVSEAVENVKWLPKVDFSVIPNVCKFCEIVKANKKGRKIVVWGNGINANAYFGMLGFEVDVVLTSKNNSGEQFFHGCPVKLIEEINLTSSEYYVVLLASTIHTEIRRELQNRSFVAEFDYFDYIAAVWNMKNRTSESCSICGANRFDIVPFNSDYDRTCNICGSVERGRAFYKLLEEKVFSVKGKEILHISPSVSETKTLLYFEVGKTTTIDIRPSARTDIVANIQLMPQIKSGKFDMVIAIKMLEHCKDDSAALSEIQRVLKPNGEFICYVESSGTKFTVSEADVSIWYSKEEFEKFGIGTFRRYGSVDFPNLLRHYFSEVEMVTRTDEPSESTCDFYICKK